jgi:hypothetical protein
MLDLLAAYVWVKKLIEFARTFRYRRFFFFLIFLVKNDKQR